MTDEDEEILREFIVESTEIVDQLDQEFVELEDDPSPRSRIASIFRAAHTIKGTSGLLGFHKLEALTHAGENVLAKLRDGKLDLNPEIISGLLGMVDAVRSILHAIESSGSEGDQDFSQLKNTLEALVSGVKSREKNGQKVEKERSRLPSAKEESSTVDTTEGKAREDIAIDYETKESVEVSSFLNNATNLSKEKVKAEDTTHVSLASEANVRVGVALLDKLMNVVGELVLARNQVLQCANIADDAALIAASQRLNLITSELQEGIMKTRMQPIGTVWAKFPRVVRDLAIACGKQVRLEMEGRETDLDRTIVEAIRDPLTHIVRNSVDHGIEAPEDRLRAGKPNAGTVSFRAFHEGGMVNIEVTDDGRGIDAQAVRAKAVERGILSAQAASSLSDREAVALVFQPGFSTARKVSNVSGRGVGMDVVKTSIEKIGGTVDIQSQKGEGTSIRVKIPLTLAIIPALVVTCRSQRYAIPQVNLVELVRVDSEEGGRGIEFVRDAPVYRLRGKLLPLVFLQDVLRSKKSEGIPPPTDFNIVILQADGRQFGLVVNSVEDTQEIVVKPLGRELKGISSFSGATIMGDGHVALILDVFGIAEAVGMRSGGVETMEVKAAPALEHLSESLLLFESIGKRRGGLPLNQVDRLEEVARDQIEKVGGHYVLQYRNRILPLLFVEDLCNEEEKPSFTTDAVQVIVIADSKNPFGLVVDHIADIVDRYDKVQKGVKRTGVIGCTVVQGKVTELIDLARASDLLGAASEKPKEAA